VKARSPIPALIACLLVGCVHPPQTAPISLPSVRNVRFEGTAENPDLAARARTLANASYPQIYRALNDPNAQQIPPIDIIFRKDLARHHKQSVKRATQNMPKIQNYYPSGVAIGRKVFLDTDTFIKETEQLDSVLIHEMAHVAQGYNWYRRLTMPYYWHEGIAEAMIFKIENVTIPKNRPCKCSAVCPHYKSGYFCAAAFLLYLEKTYDPQFISRLNAALRDGSYSDKSFAQFTGRTLEQLWSEFLQSPNFTPMAAKINSIYAELGYREGKPPSDVKARFKLWLAKQPNGSEISRILSDSHDRPVTDIQALVTTAVYFIGPGGAMIEAVHLQDEGHLPGIVKDDKAEIWETSSMVDLDLQENPSPHEIRALKRGDPSIYHYQFIRPCQECPWILNKAWRTDSQNHLVQEYTVEPN
jgi:hypothetical protein